MRIFTGVKLEAYINSSCAWFSVAFASLFLSSHWFGHGRLYQRDSKPGSSSFAFDKFWILIFGSCACAFCSLGILRGRVLDT